MKKIISIILLVSLLMVSCFSAVSAKDLSPFIKELATSETYTIYNNGIKNDFVTTKTFIGSTLKSVKVEIYEDSVLKEYSETNLLNGTTTISSNDSKSVVVRNTSDFISDKANPLEGNDIPVPTTKSLLSEPPTDTGLSDTIYGFYLGYTGGFYYAPTVYGYLYRDITSASWGTARNFDFSVGTWVSTIVAVVIAACNPITTSVVLGLLGIAAGGTIDYIMSPMFTTVTYNYEYDVRVNQVVEFSTVRNITWWKMYDNVTGRLDYEEKSFNYGFSPSNFIMVETGINNSLN